MEPVGAVKRVTKKLSNLCAPIFLQQERAERSGRNLANVPETAAKVFFNVPPQLVSELLRGARTSDNVQRWEHCLCGTRLVQGPVCRPQQAENNPWQCRVLVVRDAD